MFIAWKVLAQCLSSLSFPWLPSFPQSDFLTFSCSLLTETLSPWYICLSLTDSWRLNLDFILLQEFEIPIECSCKLMELLIPSASKSPVCHSFQNWYSIVDSLLTMERCYKNFLGSVWATLREEGNSIVYHRIRSWETQIFELVVWLWTMLNCCFFYKMKMSILE